MREQEEGTGNKTYITWKRKRLRGSGIVWKSRSEYASAARAASGSGTIMSLSSWATSSVEEVYKDRNVVAQLLRRAERAGFKAIALTANDSGLASYVAGQIDRTLSWKQIDRIQANGSGLS
ncbi:hypothetical protein Bca4012_102224 [Brassica carinata]